MTELSDRVLKVTMTYLGPASGTFLDRQTRAHMNGLPFSTLRGEHLPELAKWIQISASLVISHDRALELAAKVRGLG